MGGSVFDEKALLPNYFCVCYESKAFLAAHARLTSETTRFSKKRWRLHSMAVGDAGRKSHKKADSEYIESPEEMSGDENYSDPEDFTDDITDDGW